MEDDDDWQITEEQLADGEIFLWNQEVADERPDLADAVAEFEAYAKNAAAAKDATDWLKFGAVDEGACVTRIFVVEGHIAAFYALASGQMELTSTKKLERMGIQSGTRVGSSHVEWIGRDRRAPSGAGLIAIQHAIYVATSIAKLQGNRALTLDPYDAETQEMWRKIGFHRSQTELHGGLRRLYVPLFGPYYGALERS